MMDSPEQSRPKLVIKKTGTERSSILSAVPASGTGEEINRLVADRLRFIDELEAKFRAGEIDIPRVGMILESDRTWESQLSEVAARERVLTCVIASFQNSLRALGVYNPELDSQEKLVAEVRDLFDEGGEVGAPEALDRMVGLRQDRRLKVDTVNFTGAIPLLIGGQEVVHGHQGHMVFLRGVVARRSGEGMELVALRVDPMSKIVKTQMQPLRDLALEQGFYRHISIARESGVRLAPRR